MDFSNRKNRMIRLSEVTKDYLSSIEKKTKEDPFYPEYHIAPHHGLLNDPNGLSYFNGRHHIFYQWFPLGPVHGLKHWYHMSTEDYMNFIDHGIAMFPEDDYDIDGCFSGTGLVEDGYLYIYYTGNKMLSPEKGAPTQCYAVMDENNNIIKKGVVVEFDSENFTQNFRDPMVFKRNNKYYMIIGAETHAQEGVITLYSSKNGKDFKHEGNIDIGISNFGYMWECPNYFEKDDKGVLIFSPQGIKSDNKYDFKNVFSVIYFVGNKIDVEDLKFDNNAYVEMDKGFDFYAPQTYEDNKGRRILLGWLGNSKSEYPTDKNMWAHMLTIPREIIIEDNKLIQKPIEELTKLIKKTSPIFDCTYLENNAFQLELEIFLEFELSIENEVEEKIVFGSKDNEFYLDRSKMTYLYAERFGTVRYAKRKVHEPQKIKIFVDHSSIEIFCDNGETVFTSRFFIDDFNIIRGKAIKGNIHYMNPLIIQGDKDKIIKRGFFV